MMNMLTNLYAKTMSQVNAWKKEEQGSQTLEWIGIAAVVIIVVGLVSTAFDGSEIGADIYDKFTTFLGKIGGE
ncbi:hypothetical protein JNUCC1_03061 [Lentibacillus sp. JNUCC-1]|uniref:hypothetical protein n=1 Tax=Lentibacillus sp. JNUCC-1 TaxID=2654513 RepID=UPI00132B3044|nr:hypothetical protein [Lentibacillus sp. JNUCC-1]MUV39188.1 hypothetical protein [Lentibacillus sp. JNUCC-1]